ncbi:unnamed protein product [Prorocentrum cordatum]|uniref:Protein kinase domain-containing protein n=1 Tax=Prorocentrum cordatum TaxID=2364126 RepID=A0ABN9XHC6_9DINO|nr:unnamed protein product [Polarella glacialis]
MSAAAAAPGGGSAVGAASGAFGDEGGAAVLAASADVDERASPSGSPERQSVALITPSRRRGLFHRAARGEQQLEVRASSRAAAEELLLESDPGSVVVFIQCEPRGPQATGRAAGAPVERSCMAGSSAGAAASAGLGGAGGRRYQLFISFKYVRTVIHYEYYWVHLRPVGREARRLVFHTEQHHFEMVHELLTGFTPTLRTWLGAIVRAPNFIDQPVESVDLQSLLRARDHLILTRRTALTASVVLCKLDADTRKIVSQGVVFDFKSRRIRDDAGHILWSFRDVFQQFLGTRACPLPPSPRRAQDEAPPQAALGLLDGLGQEEPAQLQARRLARLQSAVRRAAEEGQKDVEPFPGGFLERATELLFSQLVRSAEACGRRGELSARSGAAMLGPPSSGAAEGGLEATLDEASTLACDVLAELCDQRTQVVGPFVWRVCNGYLENPATWHPSLVALGLLTAASPALAEWLLKSTDAVQVLFGVAVQAHELLALRREAGRSRQNQAHCQLLQPGRPLRSGDVRGPGGALRLAAPQASERGPDEAGAASSSEGPRQGLRRGSPPADLGHPAEAESLLGARSGRSARGGPSSAELSWSLWDPLCRATSFDNFEHQFGEQADGSPRGGSFPSGRGDEDSAAAGRSTSRPRRGSSAHSDSSFQPAAVHSRKVRVPPLNLDLAAVVGGPATGGHEGAPTPSMTRSSRRLKSRRTARTPPGQPATPGAVRGGGSGIGFSGRAPSPPVSGSSRSSLLSNVANSLSAPLMGLGFMWGCASAPSAAAPPGSQHPHAPGAAQVPVTMTLKGDPEKQVKRQADELAKTLGEACLLMDLSDLVKHKQELQVQEAVMDSIRPATGPAADKKPTERPLQDSPSREPAVPKDSPVGSPSRSARFATAAGPFDSGRRRVLSGASGMLALSASGGGAHPSSRSPRDSADLSASPAPAAATRGARLHACLVLERLCVGVGAGTSARLLGPHVPAGRLFDMLQGSCSRAGACSFSFEDEPERIASPGALPAADVTEELAAIAESPALGGLQQRLAPERLRRVAQLQERLRRSGASRRCACGAPTSLRGSAEDVCVCVDDALAECIWQFLGAHSRRTQELHSDKLSPALAMGWRTPQRPAEGSAALEAPPPAPPVPPLSQLAAESSGQPASAWHVRLGPDPFLTHAERALSQAFMGLRRAQSEDEVTWREGRLALLLQLLASYLRCGGGGLALPQQAFRVVGPALAALKAHLCSEADGLQPPARLRLWMAYLRLAGALLRACAAAGGAQGGSLGQELLTQLLDSPLSALPPAAAPPSASRARASARASAGEPPRRRSASHDSLHNLAAGAAGRPAVAPRRGAGSPGRHVGAAVGAGSMSQRRSLTPAASPTGSPGGDSQAAKPTRRFWALLPQVLEQLWKAAEAEGPAALLLQPPCDPIRVGASSCLGRGTQDTTTHGLLHQTLGFLEALLEFSRTVEGAPPPPGGAHGVEGLPPLRSGARVGAAAPPGGDLDLAPAAPHALACGILDWLQFAFLPPAGLLCRLARRLPLAGGPLQPRLVACERALFRVPAVAATAYAQEASVAEYYVRRHFLAFVRLYNSRRVEGATVAQCVRLCCLHLQTLLAIASLQTEADLCRRAFHQVSALDFLAGEVDLEHETTQMRDRFVRAAKEQALKSSSSGPIHGSSTSLPSPSAGPRAAPKPMQPLPTPVMPAPPPPPPPPPAGQPGSPRAPDSPPPSGRGPLLGLAPPGAPKAGRAVPRLVFRGLRPSLQGCSGLGAPPPEEPGFEDGAEAPGSAAAAPVPAAGGPAPAGVGAAGVLDAVVEAQAERRPSLTETDSSTGEEAQPDAEEARPDGEEASCKLAPDEDDGLGGDGADDERGERADETSDSSDPEDSVMVSGSAAPSPAAAPSCAPPLALPELTLKVAASPPSSSAEHAPASAPAPLAEDSRSSSAAARPPAPNMAMPIARGVPSLSFKGLRPSLQGCSGLGAPPPEEPVGNLAPEDLAMRDPGPVLAPALREPVQSTYPGALSPPPPSHSDASGSSSDPEPPGPATALAAASDSSSDPEPPGPATALAAVEEVADDSSSSDDAGEGGAAGSDMLRPGEGLSGRQGSGAAPAQRAGLACAAAAKPRAVPKLLFRGIRPSLQGCSGLGAPPPEEPTVEDLQGGSAPEADAAAAQDGSAGQSEGPTPRDDNSASTNLPAGAHGGAAAPEAIDIPSASIVHQNVFYFEGRQRRRIYEDSELHVLMLTLALVLLVTSRHGLLDPRYCDQYPTSKHMRNIPFLLSLHLNHSANRGILPRLFQQVEVAGSVGSFCLLKLLCESAMHRWMYTDWTRIAGGAFGTVYKCATQLSDTGVVAIKQIPKQSNIQDRCVFFDVFSEVACLDRIRFEDHLCQLYDYGVDESGYWLVLKYYKTTLKKWRDSLRGSMGDHLRELFAVYWQILKAVEVLHSHGIVHYDLKCDNVMVDVGGTTGQSQFGDGEVEVPTVALADFGESRVMAVDDDLDVKNRGTEIVKPPEMLELHNVSNKGGFHHDRRKKVGTSQAADIWSLGCLLFELLTGRFLFQDDDFGIFWARVTGKMQSGDDDVVSAANARRLGDRAPLLEYLRFLLARNPQARPSASSARKRFEAMVVEVLGEAGHKDTCRPADPAGELGAPPREDTSGTQTDSPRSVARSAASSEGAGTQASRVDSAPPERPLVCAAVADASSCFTRMLQDLCVLEACDEDLRRYFEGGSGTHASGGGLGAPMRARLAQHRWTHVVDFRVPGAAQLPVQLDAPDAMTLPWSTAARGAMEFVSFLPAIFDFLRHAVAAGGVVLFVDGLASQGAAGGPGASAGPHQDRGGLAVAAVLALVADKFGLSMFAALSFLSSQLLVTAIRWDAAAALASWLGREELPAAPAQEGSAPAGGSSARLPLAGPRAPRARRPPARLHCTSLSELLPPAEQRPEGRGG